jgi:transposase InsO family protein
MVHEGNAQPEFVLDALLATVWRRRPTTEVFVQSDQGSQYSSDDFKRFSQAHGLVPSMSRRGNCWDNAVMESFFSSLKKERIASSSTRPGTWLGPMCLTTLRCSTTGHVVKVIWVASAPGV